MSLLWIVAPSAAVLLIAYFTYGKLLTRLLKLDPAVKTPAVQMRDDVDYVPIESKFLLSQHFSAIAAAGPIVGPIMAGVMFGWLPALIWILVGSIFIGGVHDFTSLVASIRHKARSIAEVVRDHMSQRAYLLFLSFVWLALVYIIVAFTDITASAFIKDNVLDDGQVVLGGGITTSSLLYLGISLAMGILLKFTKLSLGWATAIFLPLVGVSIYVGQLIPLDVVSYFNGDQAGAQRFLNVVLLIYCFAASIVPMWLLLQPRGHLGGYFLYVVLFAGMVGLLFGPGEIKYPAFIGWQTPEGRPFLPAGMTLFPLLFITIACGACSGFHSIIASGTTSKQLRTEPDAKIVGYGSMLLEAMVAIVSLCCVMMLAGDSPLIDGSQKINPDALYARGIGRFMETLYVPAAFSVAFGLMAFTTFIYDTLDVCTRLGRYILQELTGLQGAAGRWIATGATAAAPLFFLLRQPLDSNGKPVETWRVFWNLFGASNQLLAALTLMGVTVWLWRTRRVAWVWAVTGVPTVLMYVMSFWALIQIMQANVASDWLLARTLGIQTKQPLDQLSVNPVLWVAAVLVCLAALMLVETLLVFWKMRNSPPPAAKGVPVGSVPA